MSLPVVIFTDLKIKKFLFRDVCDDDSQVLYLLKIGGYHLFAGKDATIALAKMSFEPENLVLDDYDHLSFMESETMNDWMFVSGVAYLCRSHVPFLRNHTCRPHQ